MGSGEGRRDREGGIPGSRDRGLIEGDRSTLAASARLCGFHFRHLPTTGSPTVATLDSSVTGRRAWPAVDGVKGNRTLEVGGSTPLGSTCHRGRTRCEGQPDLLESHTF